MISTRNLQQLPDIPTLKSLTQSLAMLDAAMMPEWQYRYYSFNAQWANGEQMASMSTGSGDGWFCLFNSVGAALKGFDHEAVMTPWGNDDRALWKGVLDSVPPIFASFLNEPAFSMADTTFCIWRAQGDTVWHVGDIDFPGEPEEDPDGSAWMLSLLDGNPASYKDWAEEYYERPVSLSAIQRIYRHEPLSDALAKELNLETNWEQLVADATQIGYPVAQVKVN